MLSRNDVGALIQAELARMEDPLLRDALRALVIEPQLQHRDMPEGARGVQLPTWLVARSRDYPIGIAFTEFGFGPEALWGYVSVNHLSLGDPAQWYSTLEDAFRASGIWRRASGADD